MRLLLSPKKCTSFAMDFLKAAAFNLLFFFNVAWWLLYCCIAVLEGMRPGYKSWTMLSPRQRFCDIYQENSRSYCSKASCTPKIFRPKYMKCNLEGKDFHISYQIGVAEHYIKLHFSLQAQISANTTVFFTVLLISLLLPVLSWICYLNKDYGNAVCWSYTARFFTRNSFKKPPIVWKILYFCI